MFPLLSLFLTTLLFALAFLSIASGHPFLMVLLLIAILLGVVLWKRPAWGILLLVFSLPFERIGSYDIAGFTLRFSQILLLSLAIVLIFRSLSRDKNLFPSFPYFFPLSFFLIGNILSLVNAENIYRSSLVLGFTLFTSLLSFVIPYFVRSQTLLRNIIIALTLTTALVSLFGIYQFVGDMVGLPPALTGLRDLYTKDILGFPRVQSTALEPLYFANFLLLPLAFLSSLLIRKIPIVLGGKNYHTSSLPKIFSIFVLFLAFLNLILTVSRGGYMACLLTLSIIVLFSWKKFFTLRNITIVFVIIAAGLFTAFRLFSFQDTLQDFLEHTTGIFQGASFDERLETFQIAQTSIREHPFVGIGVGGFGPRAAKHPFLEPAGGWPIVNNEFLELLTETGFIGFISFIFFLGMLCVRSLKAFLMEHDAFMKTVHVALLATFAGIVFQYQTFSTLYIMHVWFFFGLMIATQNMTLHHTSPSASASKKL